MNTIVGKELKKYFMEHVEVFPICGFYKVVRPLHVFKKTFSSNYNDSIITNLIIPIGAVIYVNDRAWGTKTYVETRKMRASRALVHSSFDLIRKKRIPITYSEYCSAFQYKEGTTVVPKSEFSYESETCDSGIHFFLNLNDALVY